MEVKKQIGLFFGSFNPIHIGHLIIANYMANYSNLDEVWLVVSPHNPLKQKGNLANSFDRLEMVNLAITNAEKLQASQIEFSLPQPSYTIDTLKALRAELGPAAQVLLVLGVDAYLGLASWKDWRALVDYAHILVATRPGWQLPESGEVAEFTRAYQTDTLADTPAGSVLLFQSRLLDISATEIRALTAKGASTRYLLPEAVRQFIHQQRLYLA